MNSIFKKICSVLIVLGGFAGSAEANCTVSVSNLLFENYDTFSTTTTLGSGNVYVQCDHKASNVVIGISSGANQPGFVSRKLKNFMTGETLSFNLYRDASRTLVWGDQSANDYNYGQIRKKDGSITIPIYGAISQLQNVSAGIYSEDLLITINY